MAELSGIGLTNFIFFMIITIIFLISCYSIPSNIMLIYLFCGVTFVTQWGLNAATTVNPLVCGKLQIGNALIYTLIPWILIVGVGNAFMYNFSGWIRVFSNTFGMWFSYKFLSKPEINKTNPISGDAQYTKLYNEILDNPQTIINEINILDKNEEEILPLIQKYNPVNPQIFNDTNNPKIIEIIKYKNKLGILIWNILFGLIASMISTNSLLNSGCSINII
jgi:hypothetical protein